MNTPSLVSAMAVMLASAVALAQSPFSPRGAKFVPHIPATIQSELVHFMQAGVGYNDSNVYNSDLDLANETLAGMEPTMDNLQAKLQEKGLPVAGSRGDLVKRLADCYRVESILNGAAVDNTTALGDLLTEMGESYAPSDTAAILFAKVAARINKELYLTNPERPIVKNVTFDALSTATAERALSTSGTLPILVDRLYKFVKDCDDIQEFMVGFECTVGKIEDALASKGLSKLGTKEELIARLADALRAGRSFSAVLDTEMCDIVAGGSICLGGGAKVLAPNAQPKGIVGHFTFDDNKGLDYSGKANHAKEPPAFGPGVGGKGSSAKFDGSDWVEIPDHKAMDSMDFSVTFWMYLLQDSTGQWRSVMHKGSKDHERTPTIFLEPLTRGIEFFVSTTDASQPAGERLWSNSFIPLRRWTHVAAVAEGHSLRLYINGLLDSENTTVGRTVINKGPIYLGNDPWRPSGGMSGYIDDFRYYSRSLTTDEIQGEAGHAIGGVEPNFIELGCLGCSLDNAMATCRRGYHLCNTRDLYAGGYFAARAMGWATSNSKIWSAEETVGGGANLTILAAITGTGVSGLGLCCADSE